MRRTPRSVKAVALLLGLGLFAAACGDDGGSSSDTTGGGAGTSAAGAGTTAAAEGDRVPTGGTITLGAEQWPECINPITQCANSSWMIWTTSAHVNPGLWETTGDGGFEPTALLAEEPTLDNGGITEDPFTVTLQAEPRRGVGRRFADHLGRHRLHLAGDHGHHGFRDHRGIRR